VILCIPRAEFARGTDRILSSVIDAEDPECEKVVNPSLKLLTGSNWAIGGSTTSVACDMPASMGGNFNASNGAMGQAPILGLGFIGLQSDAMNASTSSLESYLT
jgi:hypothetical protein